MKKIYSDYFQKSKVFIYPLLNIEKGVRFVPAQTYLSWNGDYALGKNRFICLYKTDPNCEDFENFSKEYLKNNFFFESYHVLNEETHVFVFNLSMFQTDINRFINGKYSKLSSGIKKQIMRFFGSKGTISEYVESYLWPVRWYETYSEILKVDEKDLKEVGELCDKPDLKKENLEKELVIMKLFK
tara:strand:- start:5 stop:559 length:555 start_codon:yes stop_codon:yes gene_type:complete